MDYSDFTTGAMWGVSQTYLESLFSYLPDLKTAKALASSEISTKNNPPQIKNKIAIIPVYGPLSKQTSFLSILFGGASIIDLEKNFSEAINSSEVKAIVLDIDSPGGTVSGIDSLSKRIFQARQKKPVIAFGNGSMASAAYWIGSAADKIVVERTAQVGGIGVLMVHHDWSKADEKAGLKRTFIAAGKYKTVGNSAEPLSREARNIIKSQLAYIHDVMLTDISRNRGVIKQTVESKMGDAQIFIGKQAVDAGLADYVGDLGAAVELASTGKISEQETIRTESSVNQLKPVFLAIKKTGETQMENNQNDFLALVDDYQHHFKCTKTEAIQQIMKKYPEAHRKYIEEANSGRR
ncbi:S49 family peptidase [uncultured Desulfosarcina sp.]|uniref:S49 family peptidase n=1 Tax=uncultured Desulfosarcina sp. TaxID=218289 RepID=UPI0029C6661E|nr:S49 family peptidase [uncultured Desulfosarcina sp.]